MTPAVMIVMMPTSFQVGFSSLNMNANSNTKASDDDLHMAERGLVRTAFRPPVDKLSRTTHYRTTG